MNKDFLQGLTVREFYILKLIEKNNPRSISDLVLLTGSHWSTVSKFIKRLVKLRLVRTEDRYDLPSHPTLVFPTKRTYHITHLIDRLDEGLREHRPK